MSITSSTQLRQSRLWNFIGAGRWEIHGISMGIPHRYMGKPKKKMGKKTLGNTVFIWLVVEPPTPLKKMKKKMSSSVGMMTFPIYGTIKKVPNHQPVIDGYIYILCVLFAKIIELNGGFPIATVDYRRVCRFFCMVCIGVSTTP